VCSLQQIQLLLERLGVPFDTNQILSTSHQRQKHRRVRKHGQAKVQLHAAEGLPAMRALKPLAKVQLHAAEGLPAMHALKPFLCLNINSNQSTNVECATFNKQNCGSKRQSASQRVAYFNHFFSAFNRGETPMSTVQPATTQRIVLSGRRIPGDVPNTDRVAICQNHQGQVDNHQKVQVVLRAASGSSPVDALSWIISPSPSRSQGLT